MNLPEVEDFRWVWVMDHWDIHLTGMCRVRGELLFFRLEGDPRPDAPLEYRIYRFSPEETDYFLQRKTDFEEMVGLHWTYDAEGRKRGPRYVPKPEYLDSNDISCFYALPKRYDFHEVANRSECVGRYIVPVRS